MLLCRYTQQLGELNSRVAMVDVSAMRSEVPLPPLPRAAPPVFVAGADQDWIVDVQAVQETADYYGVQPVIISDMSHDCMLVSTGHCWRAFWIAWCNLCPKKA